MAYNTKDMHIVNADVFGQAKKLNLYDSLDEEVLRCYREFSTASMIYFAMKESACSEQSQRMTAMDNATKNAGSFFMMITNGKFTLHAKHSYNN